MTKLIQFDSGADNRIFTQENRDARRRMQKKFGSRKKVRVARGTGAEDLGPPLEERPCRHCFEAGRGLVPMGLHPKPGYWPCPTTVLSVEGQRYGLLTAIAERG